MPYDFSLTVTLEILKAIGPLIVGVAVFYVRGDSGGRLRTSSR